MKKFTLIILALVLFPISNVFAGKGTIDAIDTVSVNSDFPDVILSAYYDLRDRESYIQVTNISDVSQNIHVQIFQQDRDCSELDFFDDLTPNDTVIYNLDDIVKNNGNQVPVNLQDDSYGYVVVSAINNLSVVLIGNSRIVDVAGYEYRTNMSGFLLALEDGPLDNLLDLVANFNTVDGAKYTDIVGYSFFYTLEGEETFLTAQNFDEGFNFNIFVYDMNEDPLSCDNRNFACGNVMHYGLNEDYMPSRGENLLCPGGGLADPNGGFILFDSPTTGREVFGNNDGDGDELVQFVGLIGINNGNGTGSLDYWNEIEGTFNPDFL